MNTFFFQLKKKTENKMNFNMLNRKHPRKAIINLDQQAKNSKVQMRI